jgi:hypothetical protein
MAPGKLERALLDLEAHPPACGEAAEANPGPIIASLTVPYPGPGETQAGLDSLHIHTYVMDSRCGAVKDFESVISYFGQPIQSYALWDMEDRNGDPLRTGVYYVNAEITRPDGGKDSVYLKMGMYKSPCVP